ncbi:MAG: ATP-binding protein [Gemmatimonadaceae bacterium]
MPKPPVDLPVPAWHEMLTTRSVRYVSGTLLGLMSFWATAVAQRWVENTVFLVPTAMTIIAILVVGGFGPAVVTGLMSFAAAAWFVLEPAGLAVDRPQDRLKLGIAAACLLAGAAIDGRSRRERTRLRLREKALINDEWRYRMLMDQASDAILVFSPGLQVEIASARASGLLGRPQPDLLGRSYAELFGDAADVIGRLTSDLAGSPAARLIEHRVARPDDSSFVGELSARKLPDGRLQVIVRDVTSHKRAVDEVREERDLLDRILDTTASAIVAFEVPSRRVLFVNDRLAEITGISREELVTHGLDRIGWEYGDLDGTLLPPERRPSRLVLDAGALVSDERMLARRPGDPWRMFNFSGAPLRGSDGHIRALVFAFEDITERSATQRAVEESEERLRRMTDAVPGIVYQYVLSPNGEQRFVFASGGIRELMHASPAEAIEDFSRVWDAIVPEDQERLGKSILESARTLSRWTEEFQIVLPTAERKWIRGSAVPEPPLPDGSIRWNGLLFDITERKRLESDLLQVQKMESIGRLAGGIAHDFNNILTAIRGNVDLLLEDVPDGHVHFPELRDIRDAAERATALTRQLLAFSRKQAMQTRDLELGTLVRDMEKMLRRVIGEDVVLLTQPADASGLVRADPGQLEQVLLNLAVNARDAMPNGGLLTIETRTVRVDATMSGALGVPAGDYVSLIVRDTGHGMNDETKRRIFDPFFTTKPAGKGTGLGLAMVYGIVLQSGGTITVDSEPDRGATFRIYFPRVTGALGGASPIITPTNVPVTMPCDATILLVEDDPAVRVLTRRMLHDAGFEVHEAADAYEALTLVGPDCAGVDLVVSDVIMPGMGGRDLATELRSRREDVRILFISGYLDIDLARLGLDRQTRLLSKPFTRDSLLRSIAQLLQADVTAAALGGTQ